jgi:hypothetical protein
VEKLILLVPTLLIGYEYHVSSVIVAITLPAEQTALPAHCNCFAEFVIGSLRWGVSVDTEIGAEGMNALGDALRDNTTLTSLSLNLQRE